MRIHLAFALALAACTGGGSGQKSPEEIELEGAQARFHQNMSQSSYSFHSRRSCECTTEATREMLVTVTNGAIASAIYVDDETAVSPQILDNVMTIEEAFDEIQNAIDEGVYMLHVEYDATLGYPSSIAIDYSEQIADEELSLIITDVEPLTLCGAGVVPCG